MSSVKQYGFIPPVITEKNWILGGFSKVKGVIINPSGKWKQYRPVFEAQSTPSIETQNCTGFGTLHAITALEKFLKGGDYNYSERAVGIAANTSPAFGNDPTKVADAIRNITCIMPNDVLFFTPDLTSQTYYQPKPLPKEILKQGQPWADKWELQYEIIFTGGTPQEKKEKIKLALQRGTVAVSVYAWMFGNGYYIKPKGVSDTHWVWLEEYNEKDQPECFDSYIDNEGDPYEKTLDSLYDFGTAIVYYLVPTQPKLSFLSQILSAIRKILGLQFLWVKKIEEQTMIDLTPPPPVQPANISLLEPFCKAIEIFEEWH